MRRALQVELILSHGQIVPYTLDHFHRGYLFKNVSDILAFLISLQIELWEL